MIFILLSIILSSLLVICFKVFEKYEINTENAITFNYISASLCGLIIGSKQISQINLQESTWLPYTFLFGLLFISVFNVIGIGVKKSGLIPVSIAQKMSLIIPLSFSIIYYNETLGILKILGICLALISIYFSSYKKEETEKQKNIFQLLLFPSIIFIGSGIVDVSIKVTQEHFAQSLDFSVLLTFIFGSAGIIGFIFSFIKKSKFKIRDFIAGLILGLFNFSSTYVLMHALSQDVYESSFVFSFNNIGIIIFNAFVAALFFKERMSRINIFGIVMAISSIVIIYFANV